MIDQVAPGIERAGRSRDRAAASAWTQRSAGLPAVRAILSGRRGQQVRGICGRLV